MKAQKMHFGRHQECHFWIITRMYQYKVGDNAILSHDEKEQGQEVRTRCSASVKYLQAMGKRKGEAVDTNWALSYTEHE